MQTATAMEFKFNIGARFQMYATSIDRAALEEKNVIPGHRAETVQKGEVL